MLLPCVDNSSARKPRPLLPKLPSYYMLGLVIMVIGLLVSISVSEYFGLVLLVIGFALGIAGRVRHKATASKNTSSTSKANAEIPHVLTTQSEGTKSNGALIRCKNCGTLYHKSDIKCPNCGAGHD